MTNTDKPVATPPAGDRFARAIERVLEHEGGFVDNPDDPGGKTRWGISQRAYPFLDLSTLTREGAIALYRRDAWTPIRGDALPGPNVASVSSNRSSTMRSAIVRWALASSSFASVASSRTHASGW